MVMGRMGNCWMTKRGNSWSKDTVGSLIEMKKKKVQTGLCIIKLRARVGIRLESALRLPQCEKAMTLTTQPGAIV